jgi:outer membrane protein assembly factor BamC
VGFTVEDRDRSKGFYYVRYVDPERDAQDTNRNEGFLSRFMFWRSNRTDARPEQYRVLVRDNRDTSQVHVLNRDGADDASPTAKRILALLHQQLK